MNMRGKVAALE